MTPEEIRETRLKAGLTQLQFAAALGVSQQFVSQLERGIRSLPLEQDCRTSDHSGIDHRYLEIWESVSEPDRELDDAQRETLRRAESVPRPRGPYGPDDGPALG